MATVTSFEELERPTRHDLRQFAELFAPLFKAASSETRRIAAAALSRCPTVPAEVVLLIAGEPVDISAPFLAHSSALTDAEIAEIVRRHGASHARSLARRAGLSARAAALLAGTGDAAVIRSLKLRGLMPEDPAADNAEALQRRRDDELRRRLRAMVGAPTEPEEPKETAAPPHLDRSDAERLLRFVEEREPLYFATALADILGVSFELAERIMLDISGADLARTLAALAFDRRAAIAALETFFPHLARSAGNVSRAAELVDSCDPEQAASRLATLIRTDRRLSDGARHEPHVADGRKRAGPDARPAHEERTALRRARG